MKTHKLVDIRLLKPIPSHRAGARLKRREAHAAKLVKMGVAEYIVKQEKAVIETKEEKFAPQETKIPEPQEAEMQQVPPAPAEPPVQMRDYSEVPVRLLADELINATDDELLNIVKTDERKTAVKLAREEIEKRG